jgi:hypothetical protein
MQLHFRYLVLWCDPGLDIIRAAYSCLQTRVQANVLNCVSDIMMMTQEYPGS